MKRIIHVLAVFLIGLSVFGQQITYELKQNIHYYNDSINKTDTYINERCVLDIYYPKNIQNFATIVWIHGGGLTSFQKEIPEELKNKGVAIIGINYRLYPKVKAPSYIEDTAAAVAWAFNNIAKFGGNNQLIFVSGHSAGGYLASMIGLDKKWLAKHNIDANAIAGIIPFSGHAITHFTVREERGIPGTQAIIDDLAPLYHVRADAPPLLLITGDKELELLGRYEENAYLMRMMKIVGHTKTTLYELEGYGHNMAQPAFPLLLNEIEKICKEKSQTKIVLESKTGYKNYVPKPTDKVISRSKYLNKLCGFWLGECIGNWTGLVTEMDKIGNIGAIKTGDFYTRKDWGKPDHPSIWGEGVPSNLSPTIDFVFAKSDSIWGSDDDTDIEFMYQHLLQSNKTSILTGAQIREGWLKHIKLEEENFLWVSNQKAFDLMNEGMLPPNTSLPKNNEHFDMIDAQLTTEIFGLFAPSRPDIALKIAKLPIQTTARENAEWISEFYVIMYSLASYVDENQPIKNQIFWMADKARKRLPKKSYAAKMYDFVKNNYTLNIPWEQTRDELYQKYQINQDDGYTITSKNLYCNGCFAAGINFGSSIISLLYGEGDLKETIKIGTLAGWDSDNPTATWGGLLGFMIGKEGIENAFQTKFSDKFNIHRTRINFPNNGLYTFNQMAEIGIGIVDRVVEEEMGGGVDLQKDVWYIPMVELNIKEGK